MLVVKLLLISLERTRTPILSKALLRLERELGQGLFEVSVLIEADLLATAYDRLEEEIHRADIILTSHILNEELADLILRSLTNHPQSYQYFPFSSSGRLMRAMRIGNFGFASIKPEQRSNTQKGDGLGRLRSLLTKLVDEDSLAERLKEMMSLVPKLLKYIPGSAQGLRYFLEAYLAWLEPSDANTDSLLRIVLRTADSRYNDLLYAPPQILAAEGIFDWRTRSMCTTIDELSLPIERNRVGLLIPRSAVSSNDTAYICALATHFERMNIEVICLFAETFDGAKLIDRYFIDEHAQPIIDLLLSITGFPLVGGHVRSEPEAAMNALRRLDVPFISAITLTHQRREQWERSREGLAAVQVATNIALTELDGAIEPIVIATTDGYEGRELIEENALLLVRRVAKWLRLRMIENAKKRIAIVLFCFPPARGAVGTAAYLDVFASLHALLTRLQREGYSLTLPSNKHECLTDILGDGNGNATMGASLHVAATLSAARYKELVPRWKEATKEWGEPPGELNVIDDAIAIFGKQYGNVFVGVQPGFGYEGDPMRLLFSKNATPHHGFLAFYAYIKEQWKADAVIHFGTHGALEFMPGKHNGLSAKCWPQTLIGDLPNLYLYSVNNPSEAAIAKRRSYATTVSYLPPTSARAGLYRALEELSNLISEYHSVAKDDAQRLDSICGAIAEKSRECHLEFNADAPTDVAINSLSDALTEIRDRLIPLGLRIIGERPHKEIQQDLLEELSKFDRPEFGISALNNVASNPREIISALLNDGLDSAIKLARPNDKTRTQREAVASSIRFLCDVIERLIRSDEIEPLIAGLNGKYILPGPGGDLLRVPAALPVGRNITSLNPFEMPSPVALKIAATTVTQLLKRAQLDNNGTVPECIGLVLWGLDNIKTGGEAIAQAYHLLGIEPRPDSLGNMTRLHVVPLQELGRARIDIVMTVSGIFRDMFAHHMAMLDDAIRIVATLDEPIEQNYVRKHVLDLQHKGMSVESSLYRVFSNASGSYGTNVDYMVQSGNWNQQSDLANIFAKRKGYSFGKQRDEVAATAVLQSLAGYIDLTYQNLDSSEIGISDVDHYYEYLGGLTNLAAVKRGVQPPSYVADTTTATAVVRSLEETVQLEARTKVLNPKWYEAMLEHGYEGVEEIKKRIDYTYGWSATANAVPSWFYDEVHDSFVADEHMSERLQKANPDSFLALTQRLFEANERGYWDATDQRLQQLENVANNAEEIIEGVTND